MIPNRSSHWLQRLHRGLAIALVVLGASVLAGWSLQLDELVQWGENWAPISSRSALGFIVFGIALLAVNLGHRRLAALAIIPAILGLFALVQTFVPLSLPLDWLAQNRLLPEKPVPGPMPVIEALCFAFGGATLALLAWRKTERHGLLGLAFCGPALAAIGGSTLLGYTLGLPAVYRWGTSSSLPPGTAARIRASVSGARSAEKESARTSTAVRHTPFTAMLAPSVISSSTFWQ